MQDILDLNMRLARFWFAQAQAQAHAVTTIACRMPELARAMTNPGLPSVEIRRMVSEKAQAAMSGATAAGLAAMKGSQGQGPIAAANYALAVSEAALNPSHRRVRANAKRLGRRAMKGSL